MSVIPFCALESLAELHAARPLELAAVRSQCFLMKIGMSENALKRWVFICALE